MPEMLLINLELIKLEHKVEPILPTKVNSCGHIKQIKTTITLSYPVIVTD